MAETVKFKNRRIRQENLREQLSQGKHVEHVIEISEKLREPESPLEPADIQRLKASADIKLKLIDKYLPSLKQVDMSLSNDERDPKDCTTEELMYYRKYGKYPESIRH